MTTNERPWPWAQCTRTGRPDSLCFRAHFTPSSICLTLGPAHGRILTSPYHLGEAMLTQVSFLRWLGLVFRPKAPALCRNTCIEYWQECRTGLRPDHVYPRPQGCHRVGASEDVGARTCNPEWQELRQAPLLVKLANLPGTYDRC